MLMFWDVFQITMTLTSVKAWLFTVKWRETGLAVLPALISAMWPRIRSFIVLPVCPIYWIPQFKQLIKYMVFLFDCWSIHWYRSVLWWLSLWSRWIASWRDTLSMDHCEDPCFLGFAEGLYLFVLRFVSGCYIVYEPLWSVSRVWIVGHLFEGQDIFVALQYRFDWLIARVKR